MSRSYLTAIEPDSSQYPPKCVVCGEPFQDGDAVILLVYTTIDYLPQGDGNNDFPPETWAVSMDDWCDDEIVHNKCLKLTRVAL